MRILNEYRKDISGIVLFSLLILALFVSACSNIAEQTALQISDSVNQQGAVKTTEQSDATQNQVVLNQTSTIINTTNNTNNNAQDSYDWKKYVWADGSYHGYSFVFESGGEPSEKWTPEFSLLEDLCVCREMGECGPNKPTSSSAYNFLEQPRDYSALVEHLNNYCTGYDPITIIQLEQEDEEWYYMLIRYDKNYNKVVLRKVVGNTLSFDGPGSFRMRVHKRTGKVEYKQEVYNNKHQEYIKIIEEKYGGRMVTHPSNFLPSYGFAFEKEPNIKEIIQYLWITDLTESISFPYKPPQLRDDNITPEPGSDVKHIIHKIGGVIRG